MTVILDLTSLSDSVVLMTLGAFMTMSWKDKWEGTGILTTTEHIPSLKAMKAACQPTSREMVHSAQDLYLQNWLEKQAPDSATY